MNAFNETFEKFNKKLVSRFMWIPTNNYMSEFCGLSYAKVLELIEAGKSPDGIDCYTEEMCILWINKDPKNVQWLSDITPELMALAIEKDVNAIKKRLTFLNVPQIA